METSIDIAIIGDEDTVLGFQLAGVKHVAIFTEESVKESLDELGKAKILILTEAVATYVREEDLLRRVQSVIIEIPDKRGGTGGALKNISRLLEEAIGVKLKG